MGRSVTPSYVLTLKLNTDTSDESFLNKRFFLSCKIHNRLISHVKKQAVRMQSDHRYRELLEERRILSGHNEPKSKHMRAQINEQLKQIRLGYGLSEYQLHGYVQAQQHIYAGYLGSQTCQKIASSVWKSVDAYLFGKGKQIHYQKSMYYDILYGAKTNSTYMVYDKIAKTVRIGKYEIPVSVDYDDLHVCYALQNKIKYCQIIRKPFANGYHYYLQLIMEGVPPKKHVTADGRVGIDIGTSSVAVSAENEVLLARLGDHACDYSSQIRRLQRAMDRSRRAMNPDKFNADGTYNRNDHNKWIISKSYKKLRMKKRMLERKQAASLKQSHEMLANDIIAMGNDVYTEDMNFSALQKRKKETTKSKNGKYHRKCRFGRSLRSHAPAMLISIVDRKLSYQGFELHKVNTRTFRASQYNHVTDEYVKKKLGNRSVQIGSHKIQRDLYSAFLLMNSSCDMTGADRMSCIKTFDHFIDYHDRYMGILARQYKDGQHFPSCMGIRDFAV